MLKVIHWRIFSFEEFNWVPCTTDSKRNGLDLWPRLAWGV